MLKIVFGLVRDVIRNYVASAEKSTSADKVCPVSLKY